METKVQTLEIRRLALYDAHGQTVVLNANEYNDRGYARLSDVAEVTFQIGTPADRIRSLDKQRERLESSTQVQLDRIAQSRAEVLKEMNRSEVVHPLFQDSAV